MKRICLNFAVLIALLLVAPLSFAQATRTWVSGVGDDANPCSRTAPCKTWAGAISKTASGGEIDALDPGGFGSVTITKPITLDGGAGQTASILASGVNGVIVSITAGTAGPVILRNLSINGAGVTLGTNGVRVLSSLAHPVMVEHCVIMNFSVTGIDVAASADIGLTVRDTSFVNAATGVLLENGGGNAFGTMFNSSVTGSATAGATVTNNNILNIESSMFSNNPGTALLPTSGVIRVSNVDLFNNGLGAGTGAGTIASAGNNRKAGNGTGASTTTIAIF